MGPGEREIDGWVEAVITGKHSAWLGSQCSSRCLYNVLVNVCQYIHRVYSLVGYYLQPPIHPPFPPKTPQIIHLITLPSHSPSPTQPWHIHQYLLLNYPFRSSPTTIFPPFSFSSFFMTHFYPALEGPGEGKKEQDSCSLLVCLCMYTFWNHGPQSCGSISAMEELDREDFFFFFQSPSTNE